MPTRLSQADVAYLANQYNRLRDMGVSPSDAVRQVDGILVSLLNAHKHETYGGQHEREHVASRRQR